MTTWLITGCSTGLGHHLARTVLQTGMQVVVTARDPLKVQSLVADFPQSAIAVALDVRHKSSIESALRVAEERFGCIDVLVNNAGYGYRAAVEEGNEGEVADLFATNFFGAISMIKAVLPRMRSRRSGVIVNVSSVGARLPMAGSGYYLATKSALEGMSDALRKEMAPLGIKVLIVEPGSFRTDFAGRSLQGAKIAIADYANTVGGRRKENDKTDGTQPGDPVLAAQAILKVVGQDLMPGRILLGSDAVKIATAVLDRQGREIEAWKHVSESTDYASVAGVGTLKLTR